MSLQQIFQMLWTTPIDPNIFWVIPALLISICTVVSLCWSALYVVYGLAVIVYEVFKERK